MIKVKVQNSKMHHRSCAMSQVEVGGHVEIIKSHAFSKVRLILRGMLECTILFWRARKSVMNADSSFAFL
jgi:hypothetical protein